MLSTPARHTPADDLSRDDRPLDELDDLADRDELRTRYYGLLQELRVLLPGVQILVAFLLTAPFATGFNRVDDLGRDLYGIALTSGLLSVVAFTSPTVFHRIGDRRSRVDRLRWGLRTTRLGLALLGLSLVAAFLVVTRIVFSPAVAVVLAGALVVAMGSLWVVIPLTGDGGHPPRR